MQTNINFGQMGSLDLQMPQMANPMGAYGSYPQQPSAYSAPYNMPYNPPYNQPYQAQYHNYPVPQQGAYQHSLQQSPPSSAWARQQQRSWPPQGGFSPQRGAYQGVPRSVPPVNGKTGGQPGKPAAVPVVLQTTRKTLKIQHPETKDIIDLSELSRIYRNQE